MPVRRLRIFSAALLLLSTLWGCSPRDTGYVEIRTVPTATQTAALYLDKVKLDPLKNGTAVLRQPIGTAQLATQSGGGQISVLCDVVVRKNRITTVTISLLERPPRCQCRATASTDPATVRSCIG
jgi:hypothetical protein